ncbi:unnamed protein product [Linum trigynum]|uniref:Uncharacterized protein n=1 Tax=Linum trigynum TaxID=586398 RepID=A0AAV2DYW7_9ROSI
MLGSPMHQLVSEPGSKEPSSLLLRLPGPGKVGDLQKLLENASGTSAAEIVGDDPTGNSDPVQPTNKEPPDVEITVFALTGVSHLTTLRFEGKIGQQELWLW